MLRKYIENDNLILIRDFLFEHEFLLEQFFMEFSIFFCINRFEASHKFRGGDNKVANNGNNQCRTTKFMAEDGQNEFDLIA